MSYEQAKILSFTDLDAWKEGHKLVLLIYTITKAFPIDEQFGLTLQLRRSIVSYTSNIAEGFGRYSLKERVQFYHIARGSLTEVQNQLLIAKDVGYISRDVFNNIADQSITVSKIVNGLIKATKIGNHTS